MRREWWKRQWGDIKKIWKNHVGKLMNMAKERGLCWACRGGRPTFKNWTLKMKNGKAIGATCVVIKMLKAREERCLKLLTNTFKEKLFENKLPSDWKLSSLIPIFERLLIEYRRKRLGMLWERNVSKYLVHGILSIYYSCEIALLVDGEFSSSFLV